MKNLKLTIYISIIFLFSTYTVYGSTEHKIVLPMSEGDRSITITFNGAIYDDKSAIKISETNNNKLINFINKILINNATGDKDKVLELWSEDEKDSIRTTMADSKIMKMNTSRYKNIQSSRLMGYIEYGKYIIAYVKHKVVKDAIDPFLMIYPIKQSNKDYVLTNDLSNDIFLTQFSFPITQYLWKE